MFRKKKVIIALATATVLSGSVLPVSRLAANEKASLDPSLVQVSDQFQAKKTGAVVFSEDVTVPSTVSADFIDSRLAGTPMAGLGKASKKQIKTNPTKLDSIIAKTPIILNTQKISLPNLRNRAVLV